MVIFWTLLFVQWDQRSGSGKRAVLPRTRDPQTQPPAHAPSFPEFVVNHDLFRLSPHALFQVGVLHRRRVQLFVVVGRVARQPDLAEDEHARVLERLVEEFALVAVGQFGLGLRGAGGSIDTRSLLTRPGRTDLFEQVERFDTSRVFEFVGMDQERFLAIRAFCPAARRVLSAHTHTLIGTRRRGMDLN